MENNIDNSNGNWCNISSAECDHNSIIFRVILTPLYLSINDKENPKYKSKCNSITLDFNDLPQNVNEIHFKNYYTYTVSVLIMRKLNTHPNMLKKWYVAIKQKVM